MLEVKKTIIIVVTIAGAYVPTAAATVPPAPEQYANSIGLKMVRIEQFRKFRADFPTDRCVCTPPNKPETLTNLRS